MTTQNIHPCMSDFRHFAYKQIAGTWRNNHWFIRGRKHFIQSTLNNRKTTASLRNHRKRHVCSNPCICTTQQYSCVFSSKVLHEIWRIFPQSFDIVVISDSPTRYLIFCAKQMRKQSLFYQQHLECHGPSSSRPHGVSLFGNTERYVVVSFMVRHRYSGLM